MATLSSEVSPKTAGTSPLMRTPDNSRKSTAPAAAPDHSLTKVHTNLSWGSPAGLPLRDPSDECLLIFRRAVGINSDLAMSFINGDALENGRRQASGIYRHVLRQRRRRGVTHHTLSVCLYACHVSQIVLAAVLTALGPKAENYQTTITALGASNTVIAGVLTFLKSSGVVERLARDEVEFQKLQDWIEETESLLSVGVIGSRGGDDISNRIAAGRYVEVAFRKYNACFGRSYENMSTSNIEGTRNPVRVPGV